MTGPFSLAVIIPLLITVAAIALIVISTSITVRRDKRLNAALAARWTRTQQRRAITARRTPAKPATRPADERGAA